MKKRETPDVCLTDLGGGSCEVERIFGDGWLGGQVNRGEARAATTRGRA